jgi:hypothetical protein
MLEEGMLSPRLNELVYHPRLQAKAQSLFVSQVSAFQTPQTSPLAPPFFSLLEQPAFEPYVPLLQLLCQKCLLVLSFTSAPSHNNASLVV